VPYGYLIEKRLINYLDGVWAITDIVPRSNHKPTVRRLVVPGHNYDERRRADRKRNQMKHLQTMMTTMGLSSRQNASLHQQTMPMIRGDSGQSWYR
jgi:hypothetical protein